MQILVKDENVHNDSLPKQKNSLGEKSPTTTEPVIPLCPPNYTKSRKVRDLLNTPDPKDETPTINIRWKSSVKYKEIRTVQYNGKE